MADKGTKSINEIGKAELGALQRAFDTLMEFAVPAPTEIPSSVIHEKAKAESFNNPVRADSRGMTAGMVSLLTQFDTTLLNGWRELRNKLEAGLQPFLSEINATRDFPERKRQIEEQAMEQREAVLRQAEADIDYLERKQAKVKAEDHFEDLQKKAGNRPITIFGNSYQYILVMLLLTGVEWKINFDFFLDWVHTPAVAIGFTIAMAGGVAAAAHVHGEYLKQRNIRFGPASPHVTRNTTYLGLATLALALAVGIAGYARYTSVVANMVPSGEVNIGDADAQRNQIDPLIGVYVSLGINLIVWLIGLIIAYMAHDEDPELMEAELERWWRLRRFDRKHKPWVKRIRLIEAEAEQKLRQLQRQLDTAGLSVADQRLKLEQAENREREVYQSLAQHAQPLVNLYQSVLAESLQQNGHKIQVGEQFLSGLQYRGSPINLDGAMLQAVLSLRSK